MSCYFRYLKEVFVEAGVRVTQANKRTLDQAIHAAVGVPYKHCMPAPPRAGRRAGPDCWSKVKSSLQDTKRRATLISAVKRVN